MENNVAVQTSHNCSGDASQQKGIYNSFKVLREKRRNIGQKTSVGQFRHHIDSVPKEGSRVDLEIIFSEAWIAALWRLKRLKRKCYFCKFLTKSTKVYKII